MSPVRSTSCGGSGKNPFIRVKKRGRVVLRRKMELYQWTNVAANARISLHLGQKRCEDAFSLEDEGRGRHFRRRSRNRR